MKKNPGSKDEQFNKKKSYNKDDGSAQSGFGSADQKDQQFDDQASKSPFSGSLKKSTPGKALKFDSADQPPAMRIMRTVAQASQAPAKTQKASPQKKPAPAKSPSNQSKDYKGSAAGKETGRAKSQIQQKVTQKKVAPNKGSKT